MIIFTAILTDSKKNERIQNDLSRVTYMGAGQIYRQHGKGVRVSEQKSSHFFYFTQRKLIKDFDKTMHQVERIFTVVNS